MTGNLNMGDQAIIGIRSSAVDNAALTVGGAKAFSFTRCSFIARQSKYGWICYYKYQAFCRR